MLTLSPITSFMSKASVLMTIALLIMSSTLTSFPTELLSNNLFNFSFTKTSFILFLMCLMMISITLTSCSPSLPVLWSLGGLLFFLYNFFLTNSIIWFYMFYELALLPIFFLITYKGYQPERSSASMALLFYTMLSSAPLLIAILLLSYYSELKYLSSLPHHCYPLKSDFLALMIVLSFLVKTPMYGVHLWLPKAHVEAPFYGSMILASIMLKMGSYGLLMFLFLLSPELKPHLITIMLMSLVTVGLICLMNTDIKIIIAYSSISHMALSTASLLSMSSVGVMGFLASVLAHSFSSSAMFYATNIFYSRSHTRNILMNKGLGVICAMPVFWFVVMMGSAGVPPTLNFCGEVLSIITAINSWHPSFIMIVPGAILNTLVSMILFSSVIHGSSHTSLQHPQLTQLEMVSSLSHLPLLFIPTLMIHLL
uniref:NADH dehydrogenase subunit 4 n=1 Tax=Lamproglena chinensis TaxID=342427 RepID=UPI00286A329F|nr:NADH dehydrogenase subunit 4 [Lamproglena chinensis]WKF18928.1 NADH dehydrogenase subunit 4 [Lamproglena chinensis]